MSCERELYKNNLYAFNTEVLGYNLNQKEVHKGLCDKVSKHTLKEWQKQLILIPRNHLKTSNITIGYTIQRIINDCNVRILLVSATPDLAKDALKAIQDHFKKNERLIELYGNYATTADKWNETSMTIERTQILSGPTVYATGILGNIVGKHFDLIILDDLVNIDDVSSPATRKDKYNRFIALFDILKPNGQIIVIGTRWDEQDLYGDIIKGNKPDDAGNKGQFEDFKVVIKKAYGKNGDQKEGQSYFTKMFTNASLESLKRTKGIFFNAQYLNDPTSLKGKAFVDNCIEFYTSEEQIPQDLLIYQAHDLSTGKGNAGDFFANVTLGFDKQNNPWLLDFFYEYIPIISQPELVIDKAAIFIKKLKKVFIESNAYQTSLATFTLHSTKGKLLANVIEEINSNINKDLRIRGMATTFNYSKLRLHKEKHMLIYKHLLAYPNIEHDDLLDALEMAITNGQRDLLERRAHEPNIRTLG